MNANKDPFTAANYCVSFIDLLGQRIAMRNQKLLPTFDSDSDEQQFRDIIKNSVGAIIKLQKQAEDLVGTILKPNLHSPLRTSLSKEQQKMWDLMHTTKLTNQYWSDGLVSFACLGAKDVQCHVNGVFGLFAMAGTFCLIGLATKRPVRGAIEIAWGIELRPGELYGPAVARAYELESEIAQFPRIVVGEETIKYLRAHQANQVADPFSQVDSQLAEICLGMVTQDVDGYFILDYLGIGFQNAVSKESHIPLYAQAKDFVLAQLSEHHEGRNTKLALRYSQLHKYFESRPLSGQ